MTKSDRVVVIGAGPVGLCLSLALAQDEIPVTLIETLGDDNFLEQVPRAGTNHPATLEMFDRIGLYEKIEPRGIIAPVFHYWDRHERALIAAFDHIHLKDDTRFPYGTSYHDGVCNVRGRHHAAAILWGDASRGHWDPRLNQLEVDGVPHVRRTGDTSTCRSAWGNDGIYDMVGNMATGLGSGYKPTYTYTEDNLRIDPVPGWEDWSGNGMYIDSNGTLWFSDQISGSSWGYLGTTVASLYGGGILNINASVEPGSRDAMHGSPHPAACPNTCGCPSITLGKRNTSAFLISSPS